MIAGGNTEEVCILLSGAATQCVWKSFRQEVTFLLGLSEGWVRMGGEGAGKLGRKWPKGTSHGKLVGLQPGKGRADVQGLEIKNWKMGLSSLTCWA